LKKSHFLASTQRLRAGPDEYQCIDIPGPMQFSQDTATSVLRLY
jgi:hypothetical protein